MLALPVQHQCTFAPSCRADGSSACLQRFAGCYSLPFDAHARLARRRSANISNPAALRSLGDWLKLEDINNSLFLVTCDRKARAWKRPGDRQPRYLKFFQVLCPLRLRCALRLLGVLRQLCCASGEEGCLKLQLGGEMLLPGSAQRAVLCAAVVR